MPRKMEKKSWKKPILKQFCNIHFLQKPPVSQNTLKQQRFSREKN